MANSLFASENLLSNNYSYAGMALNRKWNYLVDRYGSGFMNLD
jgi:hypothetical protein